MIVQSLSHAWLFLVPLVNVCSSECWRATFFGLHTSCLKTNSHILAQLDNSHRHGWYILKAVGLLPFSINFPFHTKAFENENCKFWPNLATPSDQVNIFWKPWIFSTFLSTFSCSHQSVWKWNSHFFGLIRQLLRTWPIVSECYEYSPFTIKS